MKRRGRNTNGEGTVYQRKDGRWEGAAFVLTTAGTRKRVRVYGQTRDEARRKLTALIAQSDRGIPVAADSVTVRAYLEYWLGHVVAKQRPKTYVGYEGVVRLHIVPVLGSKKLDKLTGRDVRAFLTRCEKACVCCARQIDAGRQADSRRCCAVGKCCQRRMSARMVQYIHAVLRNALENAVREELIPRNVAKLVQVAAPKYRTGRGLSLDEAKALLAAARDDRLHALYVLALYLGLRRGELLGLCWADVALDVPGPALEIRQTLQRVGGKLTFVPPKTTTSERTVPLPAAVVQALRAHRERQGKERIEAGDRWQEQGLIFPTTIGTPMEPDNLRRSWYRLRAVLDGNVRFHDLRHTCVTLLLDLGVPPHVVRQIAGHSAIDVTMKIYAHVSLDEMRRGLDGLDGQLGE